MKKELEIECLSINDLPVVAGQIYQFGKDLNIWILKGDIGSGKTTFIRTLTSQIEIRDSVSSPSYAIVNEYLTESNKTIYHFDFFRTRSVREIMDIGFEEYLDSGNLCLIEWPELIEDYLPERYLEINILNPDPKKRIFKIKKHE